MQKWNIYRLLVILILSIPSEAPAQEIEFIKTTYFPHYPSASTLAYSNHQLYVMGDDATHLLILDSNHQVLDSLRLFTGKEKRIDKEVKADIEASVLIQKEKETFLFLFSSFSSPTRNLVLKISLPQKRIKRDFKHFKKGPLPNTKEWNIEGAAMANNKLLLGSRANNTNKDNFLLLLNGPAKKNYKNGKPAAIKIQLPATRHVVGISGLTYLPEQDLLLLTATTELMDDAYADGDIGDSYLGYITHLSQKWQHEVIRVDTLLNLTPVLKQKSAQKIESVAVQEVKEGKAILHLAADNDNGESTLFKIRFTLPAKQ